ncbi:DUF262 domain-containing protein [Rossellomorea aquimaris]|uniref:GmrSD restriction endonuclease domain-containing protein n=1 Tax=Rossellomorea aquimaris TaxID=189382 RepID=UPI0037C585E3
MSLTPKGMSIQEAYRLYREGNLIVNRKYQRKLVWTTDEKEKLIDSIMSGYPIPLILLAERPDIHGFGTYEILDGVQRLTAMFDFIENRINWENQFFDTREFTRANTLVKKGIIDAQRRENTIFLDAEMCAKLLDYQLAVTIYPAMKENDMIDVFGRINSQGRQLSFQERRQAGVINDFSELVRKISFEIRGDVSKNLLKLYEMPAISIDDYRSDMDYSIKADDIFWCKTGILGKNELRNGEDEEMIADLVASIVLESPFPKSRDSLDSLYDENSHDYIKIMRAMKSFEKDELYEKVTFTFSILREVIETVDDSINGFRRIISRQHRNPVKYPFYALFMAFYSLLVEEEMYPENYDGIMQSIENLQIKLTRSAKYAKVDDRIQNIDITKGLIRKYFVRKEPVSLSHGAGLAMDFENSIRRSKIETARYEFKQGILRLSDTPVMDVDLIDRILETITAIANSNQGDDGYLYIGIADKMKDAERVKEIFGKDYLEKFNKYIVGVERELVYLGWDFDRYIKVFMENIKKSEIDEPLKSQLLSQIDVVEYKGYSIIRIRIPKQDKLTPINGKVFVRHNNDTVQVKDVKEILSLSQGFSK